MTSLLFCPCVHMELGKCYARQQILSQRTGQIWPCARLAATRGSESPNEEVLERLKRAEAEAAQLRKEIAAARAKQNEAGASEAQESLEETNQTISRITSGDLKREGFGSSSDNWLSETNFDFFTRGGPTERGLSVIAPEDASVVRRRLLIGIGATIAVAVLSQVPTDSLRRQPTKPLFQYLAPLLRIQGLLTEADTIVNEGQWEQLNTLLERVQNQPNFLKGNLRDAMAGLETRQQRQQAEALVQSIREYVDQIDSNKYYEAMGKPGQRGGEREAQLVKFSSDSLKAAQGKLKAFIKLFPRDVVAAAQQQLDQVYF